MASTDGSLWILARSRAWISAGKWAACAIICALICSISAGVGSVTVCMQRAFKLIEYTSHQMCRLFRNLTTAATQATRARMMQTFMLIGSNVFRDFGKKTILFYLPAWPLYTQSFMTHEAGSDEPSGSLRFSRYWTHTADVNTYQFIHDFIEQVFFVQQVWWLEIATVNDDVVAKSFNDQTEKQLHSMLR